MNVPAFEDVAESYDSFFTGTVLGRELRQIVWRNLADIFLPGARVLELNCGTGEDAVWLAGRGVRVLATDNSPAMLESAARKAASNRLSEMIEFQHVDLSKPTISWPNLEYDGALSNFGGLNCIGDLSPVLRLLGQSIRPGGRLIVVVMGRWCAWEILWHLLHLQPRTALRRLRPEGVEARIGSTKLRVRYPSPETLRQALAPEFRLRRLMGLGVFLPPSYLQEAVTRRKRLFRLLCRLEGAMASTALLRYFGDHMLFDFERTTFISRNCR